MLEPGPVIADHGPVYEVPALDIPIDASREYRAVFDVSNALEADDAVNPKIVTVARFLNMHARAGVDAGNLGAAIVLHGGSGRYALDDEAYRERYGVDNPNLPLLEALAEAGVRIILCGQTAGFRGFAGDELAAPVQIALSAMTALIELQQDGYELIPF